MASLLLIALAVTGLLLNHADGLRLGERRVTWDWAYALYGERSAGQWQAFRAGAQWVVQSEDGSLFVDARPAGHCEGRLVGAGAWQVLLLAACERELVLLDADGARIDAIGSASGLDGSLSGLAVAGVGAPALQLGGAWRRFDPERMEIGEALAAAPEAARAEPVPAALVESLGRAANWLSQERLLLDLHSGRLFGRFGTLAVDVAGVLSIVLALSGLMIWGLRWRRHR